MLEKGQKIRLTNGRGLSIIRNELKLKLPTSWGDYLHNEHRFTEHNNYLLNQVFDTVEQVTAHVALGKLILLRDAYWQVDNSWKPKWGDGNIKYSIEHIPQDKPILAFRTKKLRDKFHNNFKDLIEQAKMFL